MYSQKMGQSQNYFLINGGGVVLTLTIIMYNIIMSNKKG
jgi:hypothetical protein